MTINILLGPPGTGKTETCLRTVEHFLEKGVPPERIGYFAFTRRANTEAKERAMSRFRLGGNDLPYFKTLHSLAFSRMGISRNQLMTPEDYAEIAKWLKVKPFYLQNTSSFEIGYGDRFLELINISRVTGIPLQQVYNTSPMRYQFDWQQLDYIDRGLRHYKQTTQRYDYSDMLTAFVEQSLCPRLEVVIIDEAQDLSALQWKMVDLLAANAKHVYIAGDDDQAIYRWAGADVEQFIHKPGEVRVLEQSYRIPAAHHEISQKLIRKIIDRRSKEFFPRDESGIVRWHRHSEHVDISEGDWLLLSRTKAGVTKLEQEVRQRGMLYVCEDGSSDQKALEAVYLWQRLQEGHRISAENVRCIYSMMLPDQQVKYENRLMSKVDNEHWFTMQDLIENHGLLTTEPWRQALPKLTESQKEYISACLRRGEKLGTKPRIIISTIHKAKGAQATNVLMTTDISRRKNILWRQEEFDDEARVFYVGLTRAKRELHLIHPMKSAGYAIPNADACSTAA